MKGREHMNQFLTPDDIAAGFTSVLKEYESDFWKGLDRALGRGIEKVNEEIVNHIAFKQRTGQYVKAFRARKLNEGPYRQTRVWYVKSPYYRLTHLLEYGHMGYNGSRTKAYPHIRYGEEWAKKRLLELLKKELDT